MDSAALCRGLTIDAHHDVGMASSRSTPILDPHPAQRPYLPFSSPGQSRLNSFQADLVFGTHGFESPGINIIGGNIRQILHTDIFNRSTEIVVFGDEGSQHFRLKFLQFQPHPALELLVHIYSIGKTRLI